MDGILRSINTKYFLLFFIIIQVVMPKIYTILFQEKSIGKYSYQHSFLKQWTMIYLCIPFLSIGFFINKFIKRKDNDVKEPWKNVKLHGTSLLLAFVFLISYVLDFYGKKNQGHTINLFGCGLKNLTYMVYYLISKKNRSNNGEMIGIIIALLTQIVMGVLLGINFGFQYPIYTEVSVYIKGMVYLSFSHIANALTIVLIDYIIHNIPVSGGVQMGFQSIYSILLSVLIFIPMNYHGLTSSNDGDGIHEDLYDSFLMAKNNPTIIFYLILLVIMVFFSSLFQSITIQCFNGFYIIMCQGLVTIFVSYYRIFFPFKWNLNFYEVLIVIFSIGYIIGCLIYANIIPIFNDETREIEDTPLIKD